ncbi:MAG: hypothetical protein WKF37_06565, partial [Bryobacteraceae bacterium]
TVQLRDGRSIQGTFVSGDSRQIRFLPEGGQTESYAVTEVDRVNFGGGSSSQSSAVTRGTRSRGGREMAPSGTTVTVRMIDAINSDTTNVGETFRASLDEPILVDGVTVAPKGADATVKVERVDQSKALSGREEIALVLSEVTVDGRRLQAETNHAAVSAKSRGKDNAKVIGGTAVLGAIIGAIAGGGKGAAIGAASGAGAGAAVQAIRGQKVEIPSETRLDFVLSQPLYNR